MSQAQQQAPLPRNSNSAAAADVSQLSINEMLRVMDVAREMRKDREKAEKVLQRDDFRAELRVKLMRTAQVSGDNVTEAEIEAAIATYFSNRHRFEEPPAGMQTMIAHAWVRRKAIVGWTIAAAVTAVATWGLFFASFAPF